MPYAMSLACIYYPYVKKEGSWFVVRSSNTGRELRSFRNKKAAHNFAERVFKNRWK